MPDRYDQLLEHLIRHTAALELGEDELHTVAIRDHPRERNGVPGRFHVHVEVHCPSILVHGDRRRNLTLGRPHEPGITLTGDRLRETDRPPRQVRTVSDETEN